MCRINKFGFYFPRRLLQSPIFVGHHIPVPKTAQGALTSVAAYLKATQPSDGDPNATLHRQQIRSLNLESGALITNDDQLEGSRSARDNRN